MMRWRWCLCWNDAVQDLTKQLIGWVTSNMAFSIERCQTGRKTKQQRVLQEKEKKMCIIRNNNYTNTNTHTHANQTTQRLTKQTTSISIDWTVGGRKEEKEEPKNKSIFYHLLLVIIFGFFFFLSVLVSVKMCETLTDYIIHGKTEAYKSYSCVHVVLSELTRLMIRCFGEWTNKDRSVLVKMFIAVAFKISWDWVRLCVIEYWISNIGMKENNSFWRKFQH